MDQTTFVKKMLHQFGMEHSKPAATPMHEACKLTTEMHEEQADATLYRQIIDKILYLTNSLYHECPLTINAAPSNTTYGDSKTSTAIPTQNNKSRRTKYR
uniref:Reverse transcriptase Ty1/copia-type domain-containing protein n=1 Tax=Physcomitrium patens TaxID=3218 RepID=A0A2K1JU29_PHYPA|nr:hypothetical protein PHYPA_014808 [Physcomitrium patens]